MNDNTYLQNTIEVIEIKLECMQRQLNSIEVNQNLHKINNRQEVYLTAACIGAIVFLMLRMVPV